jgi:hypothetical protein
MVLLSLVLEQGSRCHVMILVWWWVLLGVLVCYSDKQCMHSMGYMLVQVCASSIVKIILCHMIWIFLQCLHAAVTEPLLMQPSSCVLAAVH